jgi:hypothetical protein
MSACLQSPPARDRRWARRVHFRSRPWKVGSQGLGANGIRHPGGLHSGDAECSGFPGCVDTFGNDVSQNIFASTSANPRRALLFKYDLDERSSPPQIVVDGKTILISIGSVSDLMTQTDRYDSYVIQYRIKRVGFPSVSVLRRSGDSRDRVGRSRRRARIAVSDADNASAVGAATCPNGQPEAIRGQKSTRSERPPCCTFTALLLCCVIA